MFSCEFCKTFKNSFSTKCLRRTASRLRCLTIINNFHTFFNCSSYLLFDIVSLPVFVTSTQKKQKKNYQRFTRPTNSLKVDSIMCVFLKISNNLRTFISKSTFGRLLLKNETFNIAYFCRYSCWQRPAF